MEAKRTKTKSKQAFLKKGGLHERPNVSVVEKKSSRKPREDSFESNSENESKVIEDLVSVMVARTLYEI